MNVDHVIYVVEDDTPMREALDDLFASLGFECGTFSSAAEYMSSEKLDVPGCLVLATGHERIGVAAIAR